MRALTLSCMKALLSVESVFTARGENCGERDVKIGD